MLFEMHQYDIKNVTITWQFLLCMHCYYKPLLKNPAHTTVSGG